MGASRFSVPLACVLFAAAACGSEDPSEPGASAGRAGSTSAGAAGGSGQGAAGESSSAGRTGGGSGGKSAGGAGAASGGSTQAGRNGTPSGAGGNDDAGAAGAPAMAGSGSAGEGGGDDTSCSEIDTFERGKSPDEELHVATTGSDTNGDGSVDNPFASIERAAREAAAGTAIRVHPGSYEGGTYLEELAGTEAAPIWIGGVPGEARPVIAGGADALHLTSARWVIVHDLEIREQTANGINADDGGDYANADASHSLIFRNLWIHDVGGTGNQDCLKLSGIRRYFVLDSQFARCGGGSSGSGVDHVGCHDGLIARNGFEDLAGGNAVQCKGGSTNIEVRWNTIRNGGQRAVNMGGSTGFEFFRPPLSSSAENAEARDIRVIANVIEGGIAALGFVGCADCLAANNTIVDPENWVLRILQETTTDATYEFAPARDGRFVNNVIYFARGELSTTINVGPDTEAESFTFQSNLWYAHDEPSRSEPTDLPAPEDGGIYGEDPAFADPAHADYTILRSSPAAGSGVRLAEVRGDRTGRCFANPPSLGAYEAR